LKALAVGEGLLIDLAYKLIKRGNLARDLYMLGFPLEIIKCAKSWVKIRSPKENGAR
jgi:hypothetical protein